MNDSELKMLLDYDALSEAEKLVRSTYDRIGKHLGLTDDEINKTLNTSNSAIAKETGLWLAMSNNQQTHEILSGMDDTTFSHTHSDYLRIVAEEGFQEVLRVPFSGRYHKENGVYVVRCALDGDDDANELLILWWHSDGILMCVDSYGEFRNSATMYFNWKPFESDGKLPIKASNYRRNGVYVVSCDAREALRLQLRLLRSCGTFENPWVEAPYMQLTTYMEQSDFKAITAQRLLQLPERIQRAIEGKLPTDAGTVRESDMAHVDYKALEEQLVGRVNRSGAAGVIVLTYDVRTGRMSKVDMKPVKPAKPPKPTKIATHKLYELHLGTTVRSETAMRQMVAEKAPKYGYVLWDDKDLLRSRERNRSVFWFCSYERAERHLAKLISPNAKRSVSPDGLELRCDGIRVFCVISDMLVPPAKQALARARVLPCKKVRRLLDAYSYQYSKLYEIDISYLKKNGISPEYAMRLASKVHYAERKLALAVGQYPVVIKEQPEQLCVRVARFKWRGLVPGGSLPSKGAKAAQAQRTWLRTKYQALKASHS